MNPYPDLYHGGTSALPVVAPSVQLVVALPAANASTRSAVLSALAPGSAPRALDLEDLWCGLG